MKNATILSQNWRKLSGNTSSQLKEKAGSLKENGTQRVNNNVDDILHCSQLFYFIDKSSKIYVVKLTGQNRDSISSTINM